MTPGERERVAQGGPAPGTDLKEFPRRRLRRGHELFRAHLAGQGAWWFGSDRSGRFDLPPPRGTCYVAESALVAVRERLGPVLGGAGTVPAAWSEGVVVTVLALPQDLAVATVRTTRAAAFGVLRELEVMVPYDVPQAWARALAGAGHDGVAYGARFTPGRAGAVALFGDAGQAPWPVGESVPAAGVHGAPVAVAAPRLADIGVVAPPRTRRRG